MTLESHYYLTAFGQLFDCLLAIGLSFRKFDCLSAFSRLFDCLVGYLIVFPLFDCLFGYLTVVSAI